MKTILMLSGIPYKFMKQRPHHMCEYFAEHGYRVLYIGLGEKTEQYSLEEFEQITLNDLIKKNAYKVMVNLYVLHNVILNIEDKEKSIDYLISKINSSVETNNLTVFVEHPYWVNHLSSLSPKAKLVYDCLDDWEGFVTDLDYGLGSDTIQNERKIAGIADLVLVSAKRLYAKMMPYNTNVFYLPNGVWYKDYNHKEDYTEVPRDLIDINRPIIFFMGGIAGWVDLELISYVSKNRKEYSFVFVGEKVKCDLPNESNVYFLGKKEYKHLAGYLKEAKVAIIPFKEENLTAAVTPLKYYEYMSSGVPVVSTMLPDLVHLPGSKVVKNYGEFLAAIDYYVNLEESEYKKSKEMAKKTSMDFDWNKLLKPLYYYIEEDNSFSIPDNHILLQKTIKNYETFIENRVIKNELLTMYNLQGQYERTISLFYYEEIVNQKLPIDYNQLAMAYFMNNQVEQSIELLMIYLQNSKPLICYSRYAKSLLVEDIRLMKAFLLKICGKHYEAIQTLETTEGNLKVTGMIAGLYFDIGENDVAMNYAISSLNQLDNYQIDDILDPYCIQDVIEQLIKQKEYKIAEELALELMGRGSELEKLAIKKLSQIYFIINSPK